MPPTAEELIAAYGLRPHPEGGFFVETYRAQARCGERCASTAIYFLLPRGAKSRLHRLKSDELWHFHLGGPLTVAEISEAGRVEETVLGPDLSRGQKLQYAVKAGRWFGAYPNPGTDFAFVGCTVAPGFEFADFELADAAALSSRYPTARDSIARLT